MGILYAEYSGTCLNFAYYLKGNSQNFVNYTGHKYMIALLGQWKLGD
jgi:hypothetical protein